MPRSVNGWVLGAGLLLLCVRAGVAAEAAPEPVQDTVPAAEDGGTGTVIELDDAGTGADEEYQPRELADSDVEMIIGGAGKDGIARRGRLKKED